PVEIQNTPGSIGQASSPALSRLLAADAVAVAIEVCAVPRVAHAHRCGTGLTRGGAVLVMRRPVRGPGGAGAGRTLRTRRLGGALGLRRLLRLLRGRDVVAVAGGGQDESSENAGCSSQSVSTRSIAVFSASTTQSPYLCLTAIW